MAASNLYSQELNYGPKIAFGVGKIKSKKLMEYFDFKKSNNSNIKEYNHSSSNGLTYSIGGFVSYSMNEKINFIGELSFQKLSTSITIDFVEDNAQTGLSYRETVDSRNKVSVSSFNLPLMVKYNVQENIFILGGFSFDFILSNKMTSEETLVDESFNGPGILTESNTSKSYNEIDMDNFGSPRTNFILGAGTNLSVSESNISIDIRYNHPLTNSVMYSSSTSIDNNSEKSDVFGVLEYRDIIQDGFVIDDFKMGTFMLTISYYL